MARDDVLVFVDFKEGAGPEMDPQDRAIIEEAIRDFRERQKLRELARAKAKEPHG